MHQTLQEKEDMLLSMETRLQEAHCKVHETESSAVQSLSSAQHRHNAVEERARLAEQVSAFQLPNVNAPQAHPYIVTSFAWFPFVRQRNALNQYCSIAYC